MANYVFVNDGYTTGDKVWKKGDVFDDSSVSFDIMTRRVQERIYGKHFYAPLNKLDSLDDDDPNEKMVNARVTFKNEVEDLPEDDEEDEEEEEVVKPKKKKSKKK